MAPHVDASFIVRYLIRDVPDLAAQAAALIESDAGVGSKPSKGWRSVQPVPTPGG